MGNRESFLEPLRVGTNLRKPLRSMLPRSAIDTSGPHDYLETLGHNRRIRGLLRDTVATVEETKTTPK